MNINIDDTDWPLTPKIEGFSKFFQDFGLPHTFQEWIAPKWLDMDKYNLYMKFSALNVDFSSPSPDPTLYVQGGLRKRVPKTDTPPQKKWLFFRYWLV